MSAGFSVIGCSSDSTTNPGNTPDSGAYGNGGKGGSSAGGGGGRAGAGTAGGTAGAGTAGTDGGVISSGGAYGDSGVTDGGADAGQGAMVRFVHTAAGAPSVDVYVKGSTTPVATALAYGKATAYVSVPAGSYQFEVRPAGADASSDAAFTTDAIEVAADKKYTAIAAGSLDSTAAADKFRVLPLEEGFAAVATNKARVRIVHAGYDAPTVGIDVNNDAPAAPEVASLARFADTGADGVELGAADPILQIGVDAAGKRVTAFTVPAFTSGETAIVIATGLLGKSPRDASGFGLLEVKENSDTVFIPQNPWVYALHASVDAGPVDVYIGALEILDNVSFGSFTQLQVRPDTYTIDFYAGYAGVTPRPTTDPLASKTLPKLDAGGQYLAVAAGTIGTTFDVVTETEGFDMTDTAKARIRAVHAAAGAPAVDVGAVATTGHITTPPIFANLSFGDASAAPGASIAAGYVTLGLAAYDTTPTLAEFLVTTTAGERAFAVAAGSPGNVTHPLQLITVDTSVMPWTKTIIAKN